MTMDERLDAAARLYESAADELEQAAAHCRTAAGHFRGHEIPRGAAHAWSALEHIRWAEGSLDAQAQEHARRSTP